MRFEEILKQALGDTIDERMEQMLRPTPKPKFSLAYRLWERKTLRDLRRDRFNKRWTLKRAKYVVAAMIALCSLLIGGAAYAAIAGFGRYGFEDAVRYSQLLIENHPSAKTSFEEYYGLPEENGWEITGRGKMTNKRIISYKCGGRFASFEQCLINNDVKTLVDTENAALEPMSLYEENDGFFIEYRSHNCALWWIYDGYLFNISGNLNKNELLDLAHSTKIIEQ